MAKLSTIATAVAAAMTTTGLVTKTGAEYLSGQGVPPLCVWVHAKAKHDPCGERSPGPTETDDEGTLQTQMATRHLAVEVHIWGATTDAAELLVDDLIVAAMRVLGSSLTLGGEDWPKQTKPERLKRGEPVIVSFTVDVPVLEGAETLIDITTPPTFTLEHTTADDLGNEVPDAAGKFPLLLDYSGHGNTGTLTHLHADAFVRDVPGSGTGLSLSLIGAVAEYVTAGNVLSVAAGAAASWAAWIKTTGTGTQVLMSKCDASPVIGWEIAIVSGKPELLLLGASGTLSVRTNTDTVNDGEWHHVAVTKQAAGEDDPSPADIAIYLDGAPVTPATVSDTLGAGSITNTSAMNIGALSAGASPLTGKLCDPAIYSRALTAAEVIEIYADGEPVDLGELDSATSLSAYWRTSA